MTSLTARILTAVVVVPVVVVLTITGGWPFAVGVAVVALLGQREFYLLQHEKMDAAFVFMGYLAGFAISVHTLYIEALWIALALVVGIVLLLPLKKPDRPNAQIAGVLGGLVYPTLLMSVFVDLRFGTGLHLGENELVRLTIGLFVVLWATDSAAFFIGRAIGKKPLAPSISPNKTVEGALGGLAGAVVTVILLKIHVLGFLDWLDVVAIGIICGLLSPLGDLAESMLKRAAGAKDSGKLLPGHGGVLDRIDALIVALPLCYLYLRFVGL